MAQGPSAGGSLVIWRNIFVAASRRGGCSTAGIENAGSYAKQGIQVNALCPGFYQTNLSRGAIDDPQVRATITAFIPMGRIAEAAEIKGPALFLASAASDQYRPAGLAAGALGGPPGPG
jgi:hypothetical protein